MTIVSTTSDLNLTKFNTDDVVFDRAMPGVPEEQLLKYKNKWYLGSSQGCSCGFRHLMTSNFEDLGFAEPEDRFPEDQDDIEATLKVVNIFKTNAQFDWVSWSSVQVNYKAGDRVTLKLKPIWRQNTLIAAPPCIKLCTIWVVTSLGAIDTP